MSRNTNGVPVGMSAPRQYFEGCEDVALFDLGRHEFMVGPLTAAPARTLAEVVAERSVRPTDGVQLGLPAEFLPVPSDRLFA